MIRSWQVRIGVLVFLVGATPSGIRAQLPGLPSNTSSPPPKAAERDPLGRDTPYGCIVGFLKAVERGEDSLAVQYLDVRSSADPGELAHQLQAILNLQVSSELESLSRAPEGDLNDGLPAAREHVATITTQAGNLDVLLRRMERNGQPAVWLVSSETLQRVPGIFANLGETNVERFVPEALREVRLFSVPVYRWLGTLLGVLFALCLASLGSRLLFALFRPLVRRITGVPDDCFLGKFRAPCRLILLAAGFRILAMISLTVLGRQFWIALAQAMAICGATWMVTRVSDIAFQLASQRFLRLQLVSKLAVLALLHRAFKVGACIAGAVALVYTSGRDVTTILAGVGLGGLAVAFAAQKTLENLFGGVSIISDEPIRVGDFCRFADKFGTVEDIGLRSTRVRTLDRTILSIPNGQLSLMTLENFSLRDKFLVNHKIMLRYETTPAQLRDVLAEINELLRSYPGIDPDDARIRLSSFGDSAFVLEVFAYLIANTYPQFLELQEELMMRMLDAIFACGSGLAYPSRTVYVTRDRPAASSVAAEAAARVRDRHFASAAEANK